MRTRRRLISILPVALAAGLILPAAPAAADPGPPLQTPIEQLDAAVKCSADTGSRKTVLLVHGTGATATESWSWGYERALPKAGFAVCTVQLPGRALINVYKSVEYTVHAVRVAHRRSGQKVAVIGHSQGGAQLLWAMTFWPDVRAAVDDYIGLAPGVNGSRLGNLLCSPGACAELAWQIRFGSNALTALHRGGLPTGIDYTNIWTQFDEIVVPQPEASHIPNGSNIAVQHICPGRPVEHGTITADNVAWALALDALTHDRTASPARISRSECLKTFLPGTDVPSMLANSGVWIATAIVGALSQPATTEEPPVPDYAR